MKCIIVEDEFPAREELKFYLEKKQMKLKGEFSNSQDALIYMNSNEVDVVFLDINMSGLDGISLARVLQQFQVKPKIVFTTAYKQYAAEAFELEAFDYLLKPYTEERISRCISKLLLDYCSEESVANSSVCQYNKITLWAGNKMVVVEMNQILFVEACERESKVFINDNKVLMSKLAISKFEQILPKENFFKSHRSYIVNVEYIKEIIPWSNSTYMLRIGKSKRNIPVSRNKLKEFRKIMHIK